MTPASPRNWHQGGLTAGRYVALLLDLLEARSIATDAILDGTGLDPRQLDSSGSYVNISSLARLLDNAEQASGDEHLGLALGRGLNLSGHGTIGFTGMTAANAREAIWLAVDFFPLVTELVTLSFREGDTQSTITVTPLPDLPPACERFILETLISSIDLMGTFLLGQYQPAFHIEVAWPESEALANAMSDAISSLTFGRAAHRIHLSSHLLDIPFALADSRAHKQGRERCQRELAQMRRQQGYAAQLYNYLLQQAGEPPGIEDIARAMHVSSRTVHRQLRAEGVGFRDLLNEARMARARHYLLREARGITETAHLLGYQDSANFTRAFRRHNGMTPSDFLRQNDKHQDQK